MHLALLAGMFSLLLKRLFRSDRLRILFSMAFVLFYMLLTGMSPSVSRAGIMLLLSFLAQLVSRRADAAVSLAAAVLLMLLYNPFLARNTGFLFSVFSTIGVRILAGPLSEKILSFPKKWPAPKPVSPPHPILLRRFMRLCLRSAANGMVRLLPDPHVHSSNLLLSPLFTPVLAAAAGLAVFCAVPLLGPFFAVLVRFLAGLFLQSAAFLACVGPTLFSAAAPRLLSPFSRWPPQSDTAPLKANRRQFAAALCIAVVIGGTTVSTQALVQNRQIHCYTAAFEKKLLQIFSYGGHAIVIGHLSSQAQIEQAVLELQRENVHTIDALILLPTGGSPRVSLAALTTRFEVGTVACPSEDNLSTQAGGRAWPVALSTIFSDLALSFWQNGSIRLYRKGMVSVCIGAKKLLILPADCAILYEEESRLGFSGHLLGTQHRRFTQMRCCAARPFWGKENQNPNAWLLSYGRGIRFRLSAG